MKTRRISKKKTEEENGQTRRRKEAHRPHRHLPLYLVHARANRSARWFSKTIYATLSLQRRVFSFRFTQKYKWKMCLDAISKSFVLRGGKPLFGEKRFRSFSFFLLLHVQLSPSAKNEWWGGTSRYFLVRKDHAVFCYFASRVQGVLRDVRWERRWDDRHQGTGGHDVQVRGQTTTWGNPEDDVQCRYRWYLCNFAIVCKLESHCAKEL